MEQIVDFPEQTVEQIVDISPGDGLGLGSASSGAADGGFYWGFRTFHHGKKCGLLGRWWTVSFLLFLGDAQRVRGLASPHPFLGATPLAVEARVVLASAVFFLVQFVVGDMEWCGFFRLLGGERGVWECRLLSGFPLTQRRAEQVRTVLRLWTSL